MPYDTFAAQPGHVITYDDTPMYVWQVTPPGSAGRSIADGPLVWARISENGYGVTFDRTVHESHRVEIAHPSMRGRFVQQERTG